MKNSFKIVIVIFVFFLFLFCINISDLNNHINNISNNGVDNENFTNNDIDTSDENKMNENNQNDSNVTNEDEKIDVQITNKEDAPYEHWLASAIVMSLSMYEDQFDVQHIYYSDETKLENKMESKGVYVIYEVDGETFCKYSKPLNEENKEKGSINLYTKDLGFSTYESIETNMKNFSSYEEINITKLEKLISQSMLVSLYEN